MSGKISCLVPGSRRAEVPDSGEEGFGAEILFRLRFRPKYYTVAERRLELDLLITTLPEFTVASSSVLTVIP